MLLCRFDIWLSTIWACFNIPPKGHKCKRHERGSRLLKDPCGIVDLCATFEERNMLTPIEIIENVLAELKKSELHEADKERLTQIASQLTDFNRALQQRIAEEKKQAK